jgi:hypothetical protein
MDGNIGGNNGHHEVIAEMSRESSSNANIDGVGRPSASRTNLNVGRYTGGGSSGGFF